MDLQFDDEQRMLQESVARLALGYRDVAAPDRASRAVEARTAQAEMGLFAVCFDAEEGGLGLGAVEAMIVAEALAPALLSNEWVAAAIFAGTMLHLSLPDTRRTELIASVAVGKARIAAGLNGGMVCRSGRLSGATRLIVGGADASHLIVMGLDGSERGLYLVDADAAGVERRGYALHGGGYACDLMLDNVLGEPLDARPADFVIERAHAAALAATVAEAVGIMSAALDITVDYLKTREQFGAPIGRNQALQHQAAEALVELEQARSAAIYAAMMIDETDLTERRRALAASKIVADHAANVVGKIVVQLHGGIGVSDEHPVSHYFRRLTAIRLSYGTTDDHLADMVAA